MTKLGIMNQLSQLVTSFNTAMADDMAKKNNPNRRQGGEAQWAIVAHCLANITGQEDWNNQGAFLQEYFSGENK